MPAGVIRTWFNMYAATPATVAAQKAEEGAPALNPATGYVSLFRHGSHQSGTRAWLRPRVRRRFSAALAATRYTKVEKSASPRKR